jgi:tight adherence protein B
MFLVLHIGRASSSSTEYEQFEQSIRDINKSELESDRKKEGFINTKTWGGYWLQLALNAGIQPKAENDPSRFILIGTVVIAAVGFLVWPRDILGGIAFGIGTLVLVRAWLLHEAKKRTRTLERQLPLLISGLRANLQANQTPPSALVAVAADMPSPLGDELRIMSSELEVNVPLDEALTRLADRVPSRDIQFLVSAIKIAVTSGSDLDPQLKIIQDIVDNRTRLQQKLASAVASVNPTIWVSAITIPAMFIFQFFSSPQTKDFWFSIMGFVCLIIVGFLYALGLFISKKLVDGVEKA